MYIYIWGVRICIKVLRKRCLLYGGMVVLFGTGALLSSGCVCEKISTLCRRPVAIEEARDKRYRGGRALLH